jgi:hypothetical protein
MNFLKLKLSIKKKTALIMLIHSIVMILAYFTIRYFNPSYPIPGDHNLIQFDTYFYDSIRTTGYEYVPGIGNNLAFFPLFPLFWKLTTLSPSMMSLLNYLIFFGSFIHLLSTEKLNLSTLLLLISLPSFIFFVVPYSESLFFLFCTFIVVGYKKKSDYMLYLGFFGASMVRSVCLVFIPAIILCELISSNRTETIVERIISTCYKLVATVAGLLVAMIYVATKTDTWFYFIEIQKYWHRQWLMIKLPLTTIGAERVQGLDGITFILGTIAIGYIIWRFFKSAFNYLKKTYALDPLVDQSIIFSALYIAGMTLLDTFFTTYYKEQTNIWSINRHILATPFAVTFLIFLARDFSPSKNVRTLIAIFLIGSIYFTGVFQFPNVQVLLLFLGFISTFLALKYIPASKRYFILYYILAVYLQATFFKDFITGGWVG